MNNPTQKITVSLEDKDLRRYHVTLSGGYHYFSARSVRERLGYYSVHRLVAARMAGRSLAKHELVDHINGTKTDNRRSNLRVVSNMENRWNAGPYMNRRYRGVVYRPRRRKFEAAIRHDGIYYFIGESSDIREAAWMYDQWALALREDYCKTNFRYV